MASNNNIFTDKQTNNWFKACIALNLTKEGLTDFVVTELLNVQNRVGRSCGQCYIQNLTLCPTQDVCKKGNTITVLSTILYNTRHAKHVIKLNKISHCYIDLKVLVGQTLKLNYGRQIRGKSVNATSHGTDIAAYHLCKNLTSMVWLALCWTARISRHASPPHVYHRLHLISNAR